MCPNQRTFLTKKTNSCYIFRCSKAILVLSVNKSPYQVSYCVRALPNMPPICIDYYIYIQPIYSIIYFIYYINWSCLSVYNVCTIIQKWNNKYLKKKGKRLLTSTRKHPATNEQYYCPFHLFTTSYCPAIARLRILLETVFILYLSKKVFRIRR
jgi:hypothetical protein